MIRLYNSLTRKKEPFRPIKNKRVGIYTCGPTVYWYQHIGNLRSYIFADILKRTFLYNGYKVKHVVNVTDVGHLTSDEDEGEDKIEKAAQKEHRTAKEISKYYWRAFRDDFKKLNILEPDIWSWATDNIEKQIDLIRRLEKKGFTYKTNDGIYFDTSKFKNYGQLARLKKTGLKPGERTEMREKKNITDFALWKFSEKPGQRQQEWQSPWGLGFPGWHIECSAMSIKYLGPTFDIHCGGVDNIFPHHENEIAQSEAFFEKPFVRYWLHCHHLVVDGEKMAKSKGNFYTLRDLIETRGVDPSVLRMFLVSTHYRKVLNFTFDALDQAASALKRIKDFVYELEHRPFIAAETSVAGSLIAAAESKFREGLGDDLNASAAFTALFDLIRKANALIQKEKIGANEAKALLSFVYQIDGVLAVLPERREDTISETLRAKIEEREQARKDGKWTEADRLRKELFEAGIALEDTKDGIRWKISPKTGSN